MKYTLEYKFSYLMILCSVFMIASCGVQSKESYLEDYGSFIAKVSKEYKNYDATDWKNTNKKYKLLSETYYDKFEDQLTFKEDLIITKYEFQYAYYSLFAQSSKDIKEPFEKEDFKELREKVKYFIDNDLKEGLDNILEQTNETGGTLKEEIEALIKELEQ